MVVTLVSKPAFLVSNDGGEPGPEWRQPFCPPDLVMSLVEHCASNSCKHTPER